MPKRTDIESILIIGAGPIVIGQGAEFDYSGTQACKALREEGYRVVLINSNPATIMTDPDMADRTYIEPITPEFIEKILENERSTGRPIHALLPTLGGQTGLNCAMECHERGILNRFDVQMIGANPAAIHRAEDRTAFKETMIGIGLDVPRSGVAASWEHARRILDEVHLPCCIRPAYTLGGEGGGFCRTMEEFETIARRGLAASRVGEILIEESLWGWKEFELEVMRDRADNVVIICSIENIDPMGVHTGDSITVAPAQTLTDREYQHMRNSAIAIIRAIGVETGGCNIQFAVEPTTGRQVVIEMNPRVSRSSALASKATGYPIARVAAKLAVGYTLDELPNDITKTTPASFEPTIDYVVVKMPRWTFEKFPDCDETLTTQMKSVGEAMAIGRTFKEAFQKCIRSMEIQRYGFGLDGNDAWLKQRASHESTKPRSHGDQNRDLKGADQECHEGKRASAEATKRRGHEVSLPLCQGGIEGGDQNRARDSLVGGSTATEAPPDTEEQHARHWPIRDDVLCDKLAQPCQGRPHYIRYALKMGWTIAQINELTGIDPWFLEQMRELVEAEQDFLTNGDVGRAKKLGYSDVQLGGLRAGLNAAHRCTPVYKLVDTCAAEFEALTPYYYSTHETPPQSINDHAAPAPCAADNQLTAVAPRTTRLQNHQIANFFPDELRDSQCPKVIILGGGPNRIGQGIEFDYCCCHAAFAAKSAGFESVMVNSNPETVSTDFDTSDLLFFEPLTHEDVLNIVRRLDQPSDEVDPSRDRQGAVIICDEATKPRSHELKCEPHESNWAQRSSRSHDSITRLPDCEITKSIRGVIVQFGGQTPLNLAQPLKDAGVPILGTQPEMIHLAEDREQFQQVLRELSLLQPPSGIARNRGEAHGVAERIGFPVLVRPSYVLGGRGMKICNNAADLNEFLDAAFAASDRLNPDRPILIDKFLVDAIEVDVDAVADFGRDESGMRNAGFGYSGFGIRSERNPSASADIHDSAFAIPPSTCMVAGIMEHIEEAGIHSGDSTAVLPPFSIGRSVVEDIFRSTKRLARRLNVCGAMNIQYAVLNRTVYVLEVNPRASRTLPFVAKATGVPWATIATRVMLGEPLTDVLQAYGVSETPWPKHVSIKAPVFPFHKFPGVDVILGPEMRSTGEVMSIAPNFGQAFAKAQIATGFSLPTGGNALVSVNDPDKPRIVSIARDLHDLGFNLFSTVGTRNVLAEAGIPATPVSKSSDSGDALFLKDLIEDGTLNLLINTPIRTGPASAEGRWRAAANARRVPLITTIAGARAAVAAIRALSKDDDGKDPLPLGVQPLQDYFAEASRRPQSD